MPRNLDRRVEVLFPIEDPVIKKALISTILAVQLKDTVKARMLKSDGTYERKSPEPQQELVNAQAWFVQHRGIWYNASQ